MARTTRSTHFPDGRNPIRRSSPDELFLITLEVRPVAGEDAFKSVGGAFANCWINADDLRSAQLRAVALVEESGWRVHRICEWEIVTEATYSDRQPPEEGPDLRDIVTQAFVDGEVCVMHTWPVDAPDGNEDA
jgi:hypothetical protein